MKKDYILVIGGTSGIGLETVKMLNNKNDVIVVGRNFSKILENKNLRTINIPCDISFKEQRTALLDNLEQYNITKIIHCAGIFKIDGMNSKEYKKKYKSIKIGGIEIIEEIIKRHNNIKNVCVISSLYTLLPNIPKLVPLFEKQINILLEKRTIKLKGVISNCIAPGLTKTPLAEKAFGGDAGMKKILEFSPGSRMVDPKEVARKILCLLFQKDIDKKIIAVDGDFLFFVKK